jgi:hypothetical protein
MPDKDGYRPPGSPARRTSLGEYLADKGGEAVDAAGLAALRLAKQAVIGAAHHPVEFIPLGAGASLEVAAGMVEGTVIGLPMLWAAVILAGVVLYGRAKSERSRIAAASKVRRAYYAGAYALTLTWLAIACAAGPASILALEALGAATVATSGTWSARHAVRRSRARRLPPSKVEPEEIDEFAAQRAEVRNWFLGKFASESGPLTGARLIGDVDYSTYRSRLHIQLNGDKHDLGNLEAARKRMAATRGTSIFNIQVEPVTSQREDQGILTIFHRNPLEELVAFPGPTIDIATGIATVGRCADLSPAMIRFWQPGSGAWHEIVCGASGAGKSRYIDYALINERHALDADGAHLIVSWIADPQEGQSLPDWQDQVDRFARNPLEALTLLQDAHREMLARNRELSAREWTDSRGRRRKGVSFFTPTADMPLLSITLEEAPALLADQRIKKIVELILKMGRKCGIRLRLVTQVPSIAELGNSFTIRPLLAAMSIVCLRTTEAITSGAFPDLPGDPRKLPRQFSDGSPTFGLGYILGAVRPAMFRTFASDENVVYDWASAGTTAHLQPLGATEPQADPVAAPESSVPVPTLAASTARREDALETQRARELIRAYLVRRGGHVTSGQLVTALGLKPSAVSQALKRDRASGHVVRIAHGVWAAPGTDPGFWTPENTQAA